MLRGVVFASKSARQAQSAAQPTRYLVTITDTDNSSRAIQLATQLCKPCDYIELLHVPLPSEKDLMFAYNSAINNMNLKEKEDGSSALMGSNGQLKPAVLLEVVNRVSERVKTRMTAIRRAAREVGLNVSFGEQEETFMSRPESTAVSLSRSRTIDCGGASGRGLTSQFVLAKIVNSFMAYKNEGHAHPGEIIHSTMVDLVFNYIRASRDPYDFLIIGSSQFEVATAAAGCVTSMIESKALPWDSIVSEPTPVTTADETFGAELIALTRRSSRLAISFVRAAAEGWVAGDRETDMGLSVIFTS